MESVRTEGDLRTKVSLIKELLPDESIASEMQRFLLEEIRDSSERPWTDYCKKLFLYMFQSRRWDSLNLSLSLLLGFSRVHDDSTWLSQVWDLYGQFGREVTPEEIKTLKTELQTFQSHRKAIIRKYLAQLSPESSSRPDHVISGALSLNQIINLDSESKIKLIEQVVAGIERLPDCSLSWLSGESDPFVVSKLVKELPHLLLNQQEANPSTILLLFRAFLSHKDSRVRANCLEGFAKLYPIEELREQLFDVFQVAVLDEDDRVKVQAVSGLSKFPIQDVRSRIEKLIEEARSIEAVNSYRWMINSFDLNRDLSELLIEKLDARQVELKPASIEGSPVGVVDTIGALPELPVLAEVENTEIPPLVHDEEALPAVGLSQANDQEEKSLEESTELSLVNEFEEELPDPDLEYFEDEVGLKSTIDNLRLPEAKSIVIDEVLPSEGSRSWIGSLAFILSFSALIIGGGLALNHFYGDQLKLTTAKSFHSWGMNKFEKKEYVPARKRFEVSATLGYVDSQVKLGEIYR